MYGHQKEIQNDHKHLQNDQKEMQNDPKESKNNQKKTTNWRIRIEPKSQTDNTQSCRCIEGNKGQHNRQRQIVSLPGNLSYFSLLHHVGHVDFSTRSSYWSAL